MLVQRLTVAYECINSIGNCFDLIAMSSEVVNTFARKTGAVSGAFYDSKESRTPLVSIGKPINITIEEEMFTDNEAIILQIKNFNVVLLPFDKSYMLFIYKDASLNVKTFAAMFGNLHKRINLALNACYGVESLEQLNHSLEIRVMEEVSKNREKDKMIIAQAKQAVMGEMIEMIAHQWRQPITSIGMIANNLLFDITLDELDIKEAKKELTTINKQVSFLSDTIDNFKNFFKTSKSSELFSLDEVITGALSIVQKQLESKQIVITIEHECPNITIKSYKNELIQVLLNVLGNAKDILCENTPTNPTVVLRTYCTKDDVYIEIEDNGGGVPLSILPKVFDPYFSTKSEKNGTGLGLYMSKTIMEDHINGSITAKNVKDGACFILRIRKDI